MFGDNSGYDCVETTSKSKRILTFEQAFGVFGKVGNVNVLFRVAEVIQT